MYQISHKQFRVQRFSCSHAALPHEYKYAKEVSTPVMFVGGANCRARCEIWPVVSPVRQARFTCNYDLYRGVIFLRGERKIGAMALSLPLSAPPSAHSSTTSAVCARHARRSYTGWNEGPRQIRFLPVKALSRAFALSPFVLSRLSYISRSRAALDISHTCLPSFPIRGRAHNS